MLVASVLSEMTGPSTKVGLITHRSRSSFFAISQAACSATVCRALQGREGLQACKLGDTCSEWHVIPTS